MNFFDKVKGIAKLGNIGNQDVRDELDVCSMNDK